jgi:hypothetical protein
VKFEVLTAVNMKISVFLEYEIELRQLLVEVLEAPGISETLVTSYQTLEISVDWLNNKQLSNWIINPLL